eukprot:NODE_5194_length_525_cov_172.932773_g3844_i0.p1 GENE.NODE_5194_length_525_cov_172.932773_g3844_i0~~NODE_5194_length_525_cov_172.932773_g3844_i0.p1  ORF type:complete len:138 (+),score=39.09 NODE_5194_length_525_cov_172.932773_g3844_i0:30-443(+)
MGLLTHAKRSPDARRVLFGLELSDVLDITEGAATVDVLKVDVGGAAEACGVRAGDTLISWDGTPIISCNQFGRLMAKYKAGEQVTLRVLRGGRSLTVPLHVARADASGLDEITRRFDAPRDYKGVSPSKLSPSTRAM